MSLFDYWLFAIHAWWTLIATPYPPGGYFSPVNCIEHEEYCWADCWFWGAINGEFVDLLGRWNRSVPDQVVNVPPLEALNG